MAKYFMASEPGTAANESSGNLLTQLQKLLVLALQQEKIGFVRRQSSAALRRSSEMIFLSPRLAHTR